VDEEEIRGLARAMTLKYGFLGLPQGGAKAGVRGDPEAPLPERRERLLAFARAIAPLLQRRIYVPGTDMGTDNADIRTLLQVVGVRVKARELRGTDSGY
ncbi:MAG: Glu/Leu/Phe/Val dehydrogenase dimerization domain-containing protein, partial [Anaerolineae bacterium]|nr:Glu/Leu/Phe/Val dehydrogenase dimerization domain-containing protein [Anaerolineae bacterium]